MRKVNANNENSYFFLHDCSTEQTQTIGIISHFQVSLIYQVPVLELSIGKPVCHIGAGNRYSAMVGNILSDVITDITELESPVRKYLTEPMSKEHRTLQQTFSGLLFRVIRSIAKGKDTKLLVWRCPRFRTEEDAQRYPYCPAV